MKTSLSIAVWFVLLALACCRSSESENATLASTSRTDPHTATPLSTLINSNHERSLIFFTSEPGKFTVWLPSSTEVQEFTIQETLFQVTLECPSIFYRLNSAGVIVQYCDLVPESIASLSGDEILDQALGEMIREFHLKIDEQEKELAQNTFPSLVLLGQAAMRGMGYDGTFKARMILANNRIYLILMQVYREDWCNCRHQVDQVVELLEYRS